MVRQAATRPVASCQEGGPASACGSSCAAFVTGDARPAGQCGDQPTVSRQVELLPCHREEEPSKITFAGLRNKPADISFPVVVAAKMELPVCGAGLRVELFRLEG